MATPNAEDREAARNLWEAMNHQIPTSYADVEDCMTKAIADAREAGAKDMQYRLAQYLLGQEHHWRCNSQLVGDDHFIGSMIIMYAKAVDAVRALPLTAPTKGG